MASGTNRDGTMWITGAPVSLHEAVSELHVTSVPRPAKKTLSTAPMRGGGVPETRHCARCYSNFRADQVVLSGSHAHDCPVISDFVAERCSADDVSAWSRSGTWRPRLMNGPSRAPRRRRS